VRELECESGVKTAIDVSKIYMSSIICLHQILEKV
jgi:hypothetical protein